MPGLVSHHNLLLILYRQNQKHIAQFHGSQLSVGSSEVGIGLMLNRDIWHLSAERLGHSPGEFTVSLLFHKCLLPVNRPLSASPAILCYGLSHLSKGTGCPRTSGAPARTRARAEPAQRGTTAPGKACQCLWWLHGEQDISFLTTCLCIFTGSY